MVVDLVDLHVHSTASSDADFTPRELVEMAINKKLWTIAITDHDSVAGLEEGLYWGNKLGLEIIPGCEFNAEHKGKWLHILGYFIDHHDPEIINYCRSIDKKRKNDVFKQVEKLNEVGFFLETEQIYQETPDPMFHTFSQVLFADSRNKNNRILKKYRQDENAIVKFCMDWLIPGKPLNAPREISQAEDIFQLIYNIGGIPVLAHPALTLSKADDYLIDELINLGLVGLEIYTSWHNEVNEKHYEKYVQDKELIVTSGSDFHGTLKPYAILGETKNNTYEVVKRLKKSISTISTTYRHDSCML